MRGEWETLQNIILQGEGGIFQAILQAVLWNPNYFLRCPVPVPTFDQLRFRFRPSRTSSRRGRGGSSSPSCRQCCGTVTIFYGVQFRFLLGGRCLCAGNGRFQRTSSCRVRGESSRPSCRQCCGTVTIFTVSGSGFGSGSYQGEGGYARGMGDPAEHHPGGGGNFQAVLQAVLWNHNFC